MELDNSIKALSCHARHLHRERRHRYDIVTSDYQFENASSRTIAEIKQLCAAWLVLGWEILSINWLSPVVNPNLSFFTFQGEWE